MADRSNHRARPVAYARRRPSESYSNPTPALLDLRDTHQLTMPPPNQLQPLQRKALQVRNIFNTNAPLSTRPHQPISSLPEMQAK